MKRILGVALVIALGAAAFMVMQANNSDVAETSEQANATEVAAPTTQSNATTQSKETDVAVNDPENTLVMELADGNVLIELAPESAPNHVARIKELTREGFYDGIVFHRVIAGFMAQTGDPTGTGTSGSGKNIDAEFTNANFVRGALGMARAQNPNSADSQFFIVFDEASHLNGQYTYLGKVIEGMELVDGIKKGAPGSGSVTDPDKMISVKVFADTQ